MSAINGELMDGCKKLISCFGRALEDAERNVREGTYDANTVMSAVNRVRCLCRKETKYIRSASLLLGCADRLDAVFSGCLEILRKTNNETSTDVKVYCEKCVDAVVTGFSACRKLITTDIDKCDDIDIHIATSAIENLVYESRTLRLSVVSMYKRIFSALPELECVDAACDTANRCLRLIEGCTVLTMTASLSNSEDIVLL